MTPSSSCSFNNRWDSSTVRGPSYDSGMSPTDQTLAPTRQLGTTDVLVSPLCLGGNVFGWTANVEESEVVLDAYAALGGNFIDTADGYSDFVAGNIGGESERIIGDWMHSRGNRSDMVIATKVAKKQTHRGLSPANIKSAADESLKRLRSDYIDVYYAHEDDLEVPMVETLAAFDELVKSGKVRHIAASNFTPARLTEALAISAENGFASYIAIQNQYNLMERTRYETDIEPVVLEHGLASLPYYSLARGFLTGKYRPGVTIDSPRAKGASPYIGERGDRVLTALEELAGRHETTLPAVALAFLLSQPGVCCPLASARNTQQLDELAHMATVDLSTDELAALEAASA